MRPRCAVLALGLAACTPGRSGPPDAAAPATLTIASYNVLYSLAEKHPETPPARWADPDTVRHIQGLGADVLLFQETNEAWEAAIRAVVSADHLHCAFHAPKRYLPEGLGVCSRYPIEADTALDSPVAWFPAQRVKVAAPGGVVEIINVHLRPAVASPEAWWQVHRETRPLRKQEIESYLGKLSPGAAAIVAGDFNEVTEGDLFQSLKTAGFESALERAGEQALTWSWPGLDPPLGAQLDHVTYSAAAFTLVSAKVVPGGHSDHVPVVVTLRRRGG